MKVKLKQGDRVRVTRDVYGKKVDFEAIIMGITNQYFVLEHDGGQSFHCYKADAELIWRDEPDGTDLTGSSTNASQIITSHGK